MEIDDITYGDSYFKANGQDRDRPALRWYTSLLVRNANTNLPVLDFGCGLGFLSRRLLQHFDRVVAFDLSENARNATSKNCPQVRVTQSLSEFLSGYFGSIIAIHVLEHIPSPRETLAEIHRLLADHGTVLIVVPDLQGRGHRLKRDGWFGFRDPTHCTLRPHDAWIEDFIAVGFRVRIQGTDGLWDGPYGSWRPRILNKIWNARGAALQLITGRLFLQVGTGESFVALLEKNSLGSKESNPE